MTDDMALVREYARHNSEQAFAALVSSHVNLVYSVALQEAHDPHLAEEITQAVFIILARKADSLGDKTILSGWLCRTARYASANALTIQRRRQHREQEAYMQSVLNESEPDVWTQIAPLLGCAMKQLGQIDHDAVVLRFFEGRSLNEVGLALGASEEAAKKRVNRALEKLRKFFAKRGIDSTAATLAETISAHSVQAAPVALAKTVTAVAIAKGATASISTLTLIKGALKIMAWTNMKTAIVASAIVLVVAGSATILIVRNPHLPRSQPIAAGQTEFPRASWSFAGYGDPQSALMSYLWASVCQSNRTIFENSLTSSQKLVYEKMIRMNMKVPQPHSDAQTVADTFKKANDQWQGGSYRILDQKSVSENQLLFHVSAQMSNGTMEVDLKMSKVGNEWKFDGIQNRKIVTRSGQP